MDAGSFSSSVSSGNRRSASRRHPLQDVPSRPFMPSMHTSSRNPSSRQTGDRFIPDRSAMDMDVAYYLLTETRKEKENAAAASPSKEAYRKLLAENILKNRTRILAFRNKPPAPAQPFFHEADVVSSHHVKPAKQRRYIPQSAERTLDAPDIVDDYYLNLLDWGSSNVLSIALGNTVYLWDAADGSTSELVTVDDDAGPVTSVSWAPDGRHIAVGLNSSDIQLWDSTSNRLMRTLRGVHGSRVGSLAWNNNILTTGGMDGMIVNNDVRVRSHVVQTYRGHQQEVCGLKWSGSGQQLASGGNDNLLHIWDISMASSNPSPGQNQWLHRFDDHMAAVKALAWCPFQSNLLASGGGGGDRCIKFWNTHTGACLNSVDTGSQVCSLLWNKNERELLSSHGFTQNQLTLWKYPSMVKMAELTGHTSRVLFMAQSPDGCTVASAAGDETLRFWNVFGTPEESKPAAKSTTRTPFSSYNHIRNVPYDWINNQKSNQHWLRKEGEKFIFPGGGTMFPNGVGAYVDLMQDLIPGMKNGTIRTAIDTGCGVASWGGDLLDRGILTVSLAPRDNHEAQVQFALERGIPAILGIISTQRLPFPSNSFDMAHCSRCLIPWTEFDGIYLLEIHRILRPGGFWVLSGPPVNYENRWRGWNTTVEEQKANFDKIKKLLTSMCFKLYQIKDDIAVWQKSVDNSCYDQLNPSSFPTKCDDSMDPDSAWYIPLRTCLNVPSQKLKKLALKSAPRWPKRLHMAPERIAVVPGGNSGGFKHDDSKWKVRVKHYKTLLLALGSDKIRNVMDMNTLYGGFAAALISYPVWVMNVVSSYGPNSLGVVYDRGLIGTYHDWCEAFSTYPRTYDLLHFDGLFTAESHRCEMKYVLLEMDRILRPNGYVIIRESNYFVEAIASIAKGIQWDCQKHDTEYNVEKEKLLICQKKLWYAKQGQQLETKS
ncbi:unnamed protein product [Musa banksii]